MDVALSVRVITYNHEPYIAACLEGILMQRVSFPFEVVIGEDCSTDRTGAIVREYQQRYPELIRLIASDTNVGGFQNSVRVGQACRGRYHAFCEGDDYWIDPLKLEKQVAFLEAHADHSMCFHDAIMIWQDKSHRPRYFNPSDLPELVTMPEMMLQTHVVPTAAIVVRSEVIRSLPEWRAKVWATDVVLRLWCTHVGKVRYFNQPLSVYRRQSTSMTMTVGQNADAVYRSARYLYTMFDQETKGQYHELVVSRLRKVSRLFLRAKLRRGLACGCRLLRPDLIWSRVRQLIGILIPGGIRGVPEGRESNAAGTS